MSGAVWPGKYEVNLMGLIDKIIGTYSDREMKRIKPIMQQVLDLESVYSKMSDALQKDSICQGVNPPLVKYATVLGFKILVPLKLPPFKSI